MLNLSLTTTHRSLRVVVVSSRLLVFFAAVLAVSSSSTAAAGPTRTAAPSRITAPTTTTYTVDGRTVSLVCQGAGPIPVIFEAGGNDPIWQVGTKRYSGLSPKGTHTVVPDTTHYVDIDAPDTALDAIRRVLAKVK